MTTIEPAQMDSKVGGLSPDFVIYTASMEPLLTQDAVHGGIEPIVHMVGSSTVRDLEEDSMQMSALADMMQVRPKLSIWLNHDYALPDSLFGSLVDRPELFTANGIADLHLNVGVEMDNPNAARTYKYIRNGRQFGCSVGCMVKDWEAADDDDYGGPINILHVEVVEFSVVGIPANQRCWVENAIKGIFSRSLREGVLSDAEKLAPVMRGLFPRDYESAIGRTFTDGDLRKHFNSIKARPSNKRVLWSPTKKMFVLSHNGKLEEITPAQVPTVLATETKKYSPDVKVVLDGESIAAMVSKELAGDVIITPTTRFEVTEKGRAFFKTLELVQSEEEVDALIESELFPDEAKAASGKTSWPLADRGAGWDGSGARHRLVEWAGGKDSMSSAKMKQCFFWYDASTPDNIGSYKLPFCDVVGGSVKAIPKGIFAAAAAVQGARGGVSIPSGDVGAVRSRIAAYYHRMSSAFNDPDITPPWEGGKEVQPDVLQTTHIDPDLIKTDNRGMSIDSDGSHEPFKGSHTHAHPSFGQKSIDSDLHAHEHEHDNDFNHAHPHVDFPTNPEDGKAPSPQIAPTGGAQTGPAGPATPAVTPGYSPTPAKTPSDSGQTGPTYNPPGPTDVGADPDGASAMQSQPVSASTQAEVTKGKVEVSRDGTHAVMSGTHTHIHKAFGSQGEDETHTHTHSHDDDAGHKHSHSGDKSLQVAHDAMLATYNQLGAALGFSAVDATKAIATKDMDWSALATAITTIDAHIDAADGAIDSLMAVLGIPDYDNGDDDDGDSGELIRSVARRRLQRELASSTDGAITRSLPELPDASHMAMAHVMHKCLSFMSGGKTCAVGGIPGSDANPIPETHMPLAHVIHHALQHMTGGKVCSVGSPTVSNMEPTQPDMGSGVSGGTYNSTEPVGGYPNASASAPVDTKSLAAVLGLSNVSLSPSIDKLTRALDGINVKGLQSSVQEAQQTLASIQLEVAELQTRMDSIKHTGLGRPTNFTSRNTHPESVQVTETSTTSTARVVHIPGVGQCKHWLAGDVTPRPVLTSDQMSLMHPYQILAYREGGEAFVPIIESEV